MRSASPLFLPRLLAIALLGVGLGLAARPAVLSALPGLLGALVGILVARAPMFIIFSQIAVIPLALVALIAAIVALARKREGWGAGGILLFGAVELAASFLAMAHFPPGLDA